MGLIMLILAGAVPRYPCAEQGRQPRIGLGPDLDDCGVGDRRRAMTEM